MLVLLVFGDDFVKNIDDALLQVVQCKEYSRLFNSIKNTVCMQVLEQFKVALFLVDIAQPRNHQLAVFQVDPLNVLYIHCNYYVTPVYMTKEDTISKVYNDLAGYGSLKQTLADAKAVDPSIKLDDVRKMVGRENQEETAAQRPKQLRG